MSGPEIALVLALAALACAALAGVLMLLVQVRRLRHEVAAASSPAPPRPVPPARGPVRDPADTDNPRIPPPGTELARRAEDLPRTGAAPSQQQIVLATLGHPLVRVTAWSYGVRRALLPANRDRVAALVRRDIRRRAKLRRRAARRAARVLPTGGPTDLRVAQATRTSKDPPGRHPAGTHRRDLAS